MLKPKQRKGVMPSDTAGKPPAVSVTRPGVKSSSGLVIPGYDPGKFKGLTWETTKSQADNDFLRPRKSIPGTYNPDGEEKVKLSGREVALLIESLAVYMRGTLQALKQSKDSLPMTAEKGAELCALTERLVAVQKRMNEAPFKLKVRRT